MISLPLSRPCREPRLRIDLVNQHVATVAVLDDRWTRPAVTRDHYRAVRRLKPKAVSLGPGTVIDQKSLHRHVLIFVHDAGFDFVRDDFVSGLVRRLAPAQPDVDILTIGLQYVPGHCLDAFRAVDLERFLSFEHPRSEDQVRIPSRVVRVQVSHERSIEIFDSQPFDSLLKRRRRTPDYARSKVDKIRSVIYYNRD